MCYSGDFQNLPVTFLCQKHLKTKKNNGLTIIQQFNIILNKDNQTKLTYLVYKNYWNKTMGTEFFIEIRVFTFIFKYSEIIICYFVNSGLTS